MGRAWFLFLVLQHSGSSSELCVVCNAGTEAEFHHSPVFNTYSFRKSSVHPKTHTCVPCADTGPGLSGHSPDLCSEELSDSLEGEDGDCGDGCGDDGGKVMVTIVMTVVIKR